MQLAMSFDNELAEPVKAKRKLDIKVYDWKQAMRDKSYKTLQQDMVSNTVPDANIVTFKSGSSARADVLGYIDVKDPIGITAIDASAPVRKIIGNYASKGGKVFVDSGAYRNFRARERDTSVAPIDFDDVFERYHSIVDNCTNTANLIMAAPDEVGKQDVSFDLLVEYAREVKLLAKRGVKIMVPLQKGELSISDYYRRCKELLNFEFIVGLPSNAKALSRAEVFAFVEETKPPEVHFLGCSESTLVHEAKHKSPSTEFSCDATKIRKHIGQGQLLTEMQQQQCGDVVSYALQGRNCENFEGLGRFDESETHIFELIPELSKKQLERLSDFIGIEAKLLLNAKEPNDIDVLMQYGSYQGLSMFISDYHTSKISPMVRTKVVSMLAKANII